MIDQIRRWVSFGNIDRVVDDPPVVGPRLQPPGGVGSGNAE
jgi:hypothetical protein